MYLVQRSFSIHTNNINSFYQVSAILYSYVHTVFCILVADLLINKLPCIYREVCLCLCVCVYCERWPVLLGEEVDFLDYLTVGQILQLLLLHQVYIVSFGCTMHTFFCILCTEYV